MYRVMIVEDEKIIRTGLKNLINRFANGFAVSDECENASAAWKQFQIKKPDMVITDIVMGSMTGLDFIESIRKTDSEIPILILSGYSKFEYAQSAIKQNITEYLVKPINLKNFIEVMEGIKKQLDGKKDGGSVCTVSDNETLSNNKIIQNAEKYIREHINENLNLSLVAEKAGVSANYLCSLFKSKTDENYTDFVLKCRMEKAKDLLMTSDFKIYEIAEICGYTNSKHFNDVFKKYYGNPPMQFRNNSSNK